MPSSRLKDKLGEAVHKTLFGISPLWLVRYRYKKATGRRYDPRHPRTFDEKLLWLMLYWQHPLKSRCADKYEVRSYVEENGLGHLLVELHGVYEKAREIDFEALPDRFALKTTHGCNFNVLCTDKSRLDIEETRRKLDEWLAIDGSWFFGEVHYAAIKPRIICEAFLEDRPGKRIDDYKVFCFHGKAHCTMACTNRTAAGADFDFYDRSWMAKLAYSKSSARADRRIPRPEAYDEILEAAEKLSKPFPFVRADFYSVKGRAVFGELTFTPHACIDTGITELGQKIMGDLITLPPKRAR